jgi:hypothetical protein
MVMPPASASRAATVAAAAGAAPAPHPSTVDGVREPVTTGDWVSSTVIVCMIFTELRQPSVIVYVLVIILGQRPAGGESEWLTVRLASGVHASVMVILPARASSAATVVTGAGAAAALHPSTVAGVKEPVTNGAWVSSTVIVWKILTELRQPSVTVYVLVIIVGQVLADASAWLTVSVASGVHASVIVIPPASASRAATVVAAAGAAPALHPSTFVADNEPVTTGAWVSSMVIL